MAATAGCNGFAAHGLSASADRGWLAADDILSLREPESCMWFRDDVCAFFVALVRERPADAAGPPQRGPVSAAELASALRDLASSDTCGDTAQALLAEYPKWRDSPGGLQDYCNEWPVPAYMSDRSQWRRAPEDPMQYKGTLLRHISAGSINGFFYKRMQRMKRVRTVLRIGLAALVDFLEIPLSARDGVPRYGLLLLSRPGHVQVIERRAMHCCIMQSSTNSYHLANFLLQLRPRTAHMLDDDFFKVFRRSAETYTRDVPCEELLDHYRMLLPSQGDTPDSRVQKMERLALLSGEPWSKVGLQPEHYLDFYQELVSVTPFHVAWAAPTTLPCVAF